MKDVAKAHRVCGFREHAKLFGLRESVIIHHFGFWINKNRNDGRHYHDGRYWSYGSVRKLQENYFPFFTQSQLRSGINSLLKNKILIKSNFNKHGYDKTAWYTFFDEDYLLELVYPFDKNLRWDDAFA